MVEDIINVKERGLGYAFHSNIIFMSFILLAECLFAQTPDQARGQTLLEMDSTRL